MNIKSRYILVIRINTINIITFDQTDPKYDKKIHVSIIDVFF